MLCFVLALTKDCEIAGDTSLTKELVTVSEDGSLQKKSVPFWKVVKFSHKSKIIVVKLCILFAFDSFACSLAPLFVLRPSLLQNSF